MIAEELHKVIAVDAAGLRVRNAITRQQAAIAPVAYRARGHTAGPRRESGADDGVGGCYDILQSASGALPGRYSGCRGSPPFVTPKHFGFCAITQHAARW